MPEISEKGKFERAGAQGMVTLFAASIIALISGNGTATAILVSALVFVMVFHASMVALIETIRENKVR